MSKKTNLLIKEGLYYDEFIIRGDNDYILLCNDIMEKYNELEKDVIKYKDKYEECKLELDEIKYCQGYEINQNRMFEYWFKKQLEFLKKKDLTLKKKIKNFK